MHHGFYSPLSMFQKPNCLFFHLINSLLFIFEVFAIDAVNDDENDDDQDFRLEFHQIIIIDWKSKE